MKAILQENQEKRCCELRRSNGTRITRIFNNDNSTNTIQRTNSSMKTRKLNRNSSESFCCMSSLDKEKSRKANNSEDDHSAATDSNDLDEYATYNECNLIRRSNPVRMSRKLALNRIITQTENRSAANLSHQNLMEASYLLDFLNKGLEQSRELPTSRASLNTASNVELNKTLVFSNENNDLNENDLTKSISPTSFLKRHSSVGCLNSNLKLKLISDKNDTDDKVSQETICYQGMSSSNNLDSYYNETQINLDSKVILRRSSSTSECDLICNKFNFKNRREIASAVLHEESTNNNSDLNDSTLSQSTRNQSKSSNRLSGLKKLGTLYKTFEDDDFNVSKNKKSIYKNDQSNTDYCLNSSTNTIDIDSAQFYSPQQNPNIKSNLDAKRALFETKLISNSNLGSNIAPCLSSSIVTNRIMKFETQKQTSSESVLENNCVKKINSVKSLESSASFSSSLSSSICENEKSSSIYSSLSSSPVPKQLIGDNWTSNYLEKQQKVKSLSKNWELIANKNNSKNSEKTFNSRPIKVIEKIERLNSTNLIQLISQQQQQDLGDLINSSSGNSSDDNETSKDDGFETQSNASSSQACDTNSVQSIKLNNDITETQQIDIEVDNLTKTSHEIVSAFKPINNTENKTSIVNESEDKSESKHKKVNTIVTIVTKGKTIITKRPSKCSQDRNESNLQLNSSISSNHIGSIDESSKRKSGSMLGLYLSDTASTKARKAETKHSFKLTNNLNIQMQSASIHNITNSCSISSSIKRQQVINRKSSVHQKSSEKLNLQSSSTISLPSKEFQINSKVKKNHSISKDNSVFDRLAKSSSKSLKLK